MSKTILRRTAVLALAAGSALTATACSSGGDSAAPASSGPAAERLVSLLANG